jgi:Repeat of unknown function (DUF5648)
MFMKILLRRHIIFAVLFAFLLSSCGEKDSATKTSTNKITTSISAPSVLLDSLAVAFPNGLMPADKVAQAARELAQNPAALKLTAENSKPIKPQNLQTQAVTADYRPVTRIQNTTLTGAYFFTIYDTEQAAALANNPNWKLEGPAFWASLAPDAALNPVHRFRNILNGSYLYTIYETEKADIIANYSNTFVYEGVAWHAKQTPGAGWSALYRFRNLLNGTYLFSAYESEKDAIVANYSAVFQLEGTAYYVRQDALAAEIINGIVVPPAPDPIANNATLAGVDSNSNGVRDDVDRKIAELLGSNVINYQEAVLVARTEVTAMLNPVAINITAHLDAVACRTGDRTARKASSEITKLTLNTKERSQAYAKAFAGVSLEDCRK